ncbi:phage tail fiber protein [Enterobacter hormaechei]|uniref:phage tail fiber domain-containing protein n=1 Tax=Enterobacter hormaechei TaxID=158836 RepID=UPI001EECA3BA|nr:MULTISPECIES: phage tail fiber protein [Enterobacteriaceae]MDA4644577.1 phage tail fiber protein [Enterobacter hormaechei]MDA4842147.1 phage tail fiber protein [Enterobacter hormaechei]
MSVPNQTPYIIYNANGLTTVFPFEFYIINSGDIQVTINGTVITSGYTVSGVGNIAGGDVIFITPPANGSVVMLERVVPTYRLTDYQDNGDLLADTVNKDFDRLWMAIQRAFIYLGLALRRPLFGGPFNAEGYRISKLGAPAESSDATTKKYVDDIYDYLRQTVETAIDTIKNGLYGYNTKKSFELGNTLNFPNDALYYESEGEYYRWDGGLPKVVAPGSTPDSAGGVGKGKWVGVGDASLRSALAKPDGVHLVGGAAKQSDLDDTNTTLESRNYVKYTRASEFAKVMASGTPLKIKLFGDSTMWGSLPPSLVETENPPYKMLKEALQAVTGVSNDVMRYAIPGTTLYDMLRGTDGSGLTFEQRLIESPCDVVYCNHCINDNQTGKDLHQYRLDLIEFVRISRAHNAVPVLVTANPQTTILIGTEVNSKRFPLFVETMRQVAKNLSVDVVDNNYYMNQSLNVFNVNSIFPDGVHMSNAAYRQYGYNLAIPFIACHTLYDSNSRAGVHGTQWFTNSANYQISQQGARCGETISWEKEVGKTTGINFPVILDKGAKSLLINQLQWGSSARGNAYVNANAAGLVYPNRSIGNTSTLDWDSLTKLNIQLFAGLNIVGLLININAISIGTGMTFSGVLLHNGNISSMTSVLGEPYSKESMCNFDSIALNYNFANGSECSISDNSGGKVASIKLVGTTFRASVFKDNTEIVGGDIATSATPGVYQVKFRILDESIEFGLDAAGLRLDTPVGPSNLRLSTPSASYCLLRD